jgi:starch synthase
MTVLVSHPHGNPNVRAVLRALHGAEMLDSFHTCLAIPNKLITAGWLPADLRRELARRSFPEIPSSLLRIRPFRELMRLTARQIGFRALLTHETGYACVDHVYRDLDQAVARYLSRSGTTLRAIYAYEDGALYSFRAAQHRNIRKIYELPIAYWKKARLILSEESELRPEWASTLISLTNSDEKYLRKDEEIDLADHIIVASAFSRASVLAYFGNYKNITVIPYGSPCPLICAPSPRLPSNPMRIFYAGLLQQRKGISYLFESVNKVDFPWELILAGSKPGEACPALDAALADPRCRWLGSVPHATLLEEMTKAHVFVFPSLFEGFGLVILEAMAAGLPVITTPHTGGPDCLTDGVDGFIVPIRDADAIARHLTQLYEDEDRRQAMGTAALAKAKALSWQRYEQQIVALVKETIA